MASYCKFTGAALTDDAKSPIRQMCLNCKYVSENSDGLFSCTSPEVLELKKKKLLKTMPDDVVVKDFSLSAIALKEPTKICACYKADVDGLISELIKIFGATEDTPTTKMEMKTKIRASENTEETIIGLH